MKLSGHVDMTTRYPIRAHRAADWRAFALVENELSTGNYVLRDNLSLSCKHRDSILKSL
jgi:hypothetical protein